MFRLAATVAGAALLVPGAAPLAAQRGPVFLEPGHWSYDAIRRLHVAGLAPLSSDHSLAPVTVQHALAVFTHADSAAAGRSGLAALAAGYRAQLLSEADTTGLLAGSRASGGWTAASGEARGGDGYFIFEDWEGAQPLDAVSGPAAVWRGHGYLRPWLSWSMEGGRVADAWVMPAAVLGAAVGPFDLWAGRRRLQYGAGRGGGTVIGGAVNDVPALAHRTGYTFQGVGLHVREPFYFPSWLRVLGPDRVEVAAGRLSRVGRVEGPFVVFGRLIGTPFTPRLVLGINRGAIFGGEGIPITGGRLLGLLVGLHGGEGGEFENQVFSTLVRFRPPLGPVPLELYVEWGMDDTAGAVRDTPGIVAGVDLAAVPGLEAVAVGLERTNFAESCCGNPIWYRHIFYRGSWADEGRLIAHPIGGHGTEWLAHARLDLPDRGVLLRGEAFSRHRLHENLFALERTGRSRGATAGLDIRFARGTGLQIDGSYERGDGWETVQAAAFITRSFGPGSR